MTNYKIGYYVETAEGKAFVCLKVLRAEFDTEAEAMVRRMGENGKPVDLDGNQLNGLYIRRSGVEWFAGY